MNIVSIEYHDVVSPGAPDSSGFLGSGPASYKLEIPTFDRHLTEISKRRPSRQLTVLDLLSGKVDSQGVLFTFDDGGISAATVIAPTLERFGARGHFFVTTDRIDTPGFLTREHIQELAARGHIIGSHTCSHPPLMAHCSDEQLRDEWHRSSSMLERLLGFPTLTASIPGGLYAPRVAAAAAAAGLRVLFTSAPSTRAVMIDGCLVLGRFTMRRRTSPEYAAAIAAGHVMPRLREWMMRGAMTALRKAGGPYYLRLRTMLFAKSAGR